MNKNLEEKYRNVIENNVNVGKSNVFMEFIILVSGIVAICFMLFICADFIGGIFVDKLSNETQMKIEKAFSFGIKPLEKEKNSDIIKLENIRNKIVSLDKELQGKSDFPIYEIQEKEINAFIAPNGSIFFTKGLLSEIKNEEVLTFVLAHELGHYAHRDHLKSISREIIVAFVTSIFYTGNRDINMTISNISDLNALKYSRNQERNADKYANNVVYKLYGNNNSAIEFFKLLEEKENIPEYLQYFSTHPSPKQRIKYIKKNNPLN